MPKGHYQRTPRKATFVAARDERLRDLDRMIFADAVSAPRAKGAYRREWARWRKTFWRGKAIA